MKCYIDNVYFVEQNTESTETGNKTTVTFLTSSNDIVKAKVTNPTAYAEAEKFTKYRRLYVDVFAYDNKLYYKLLEVTKWQRMKSL